MMNILVFQVLVAVAEAVRVQTLYDKSASSANHPKEQIGGLFKIDRSTPLGEGSFGKVFRAQRVAGSAYRMLDKYKQFKKFTLKSVQNLKS